VAGSDGDGGARGGGRAPVIHSGTGQLLQHWERGVDGEVAPN
jgi:hypothetical protein